MPKYCFALILILSVFLFACVGYESPTEKIQPVINESNVKNATAPKETPTPLPKKTVEPAFTPPPLIMTPVHPGTTIQDFIRLYNKRNSTELYEMFSDRVRENKSLDDLEDELGFAEKHNVILNTGENLFEKDVPVKNGSALFKVNLTISANNSTRNATIEFPILYVKYTVRKGDYTYIGFNAMIDSWVFDEIRQKIGVRE